MFKVRYKTINSRCEIFEVYAVKNSEVNGELLFLIYKNKRWDWDCANYYEPI